MLTGDPFPIVLMHSPILWPLTCLCVDQSCQSPISELLSKSSSAWQILLYSQLSQFRKSRRIRPQLPDLVLDGLLLDRGEESGETILEAWEFGKCCRVPYVDVADCCSCATESDANSPSAQLRPYFWHCPTSFWWPFSCSSWCVGSKAGTGLNRRRSCTFLGHSMI